MVVDVDDVSVAAAEANIAVVHRVSSLLLRIWLLLALISFPVINHYNRPHPLPSVIMILDKVVNIIHYIAYSDHTVL